MEAVKPLGKMPKTDLLAIVAAEGVQIEEGATIAVLIEAILAHRAQAAETTQEAPTAPRPRDAAGRELDEYGLPLSGPARAALLAELGRPDPRAEPEGWTIGELLLAISADPATILASAPADANSQG